MKKLLLIFLVFVSISAYSQNSTGKVYIPWLKAQDITNTRHFIWHGDTIDFDWLKQPIDSVVISDNWFKFYKGGEVIDSAYFDYTQEIDTFRMAGDSLQLKLTKEDDSHYVDMNRFANKLDTVAHDSTLEGRGTEFDPLKLDSILLSNIIQTVYTITLPQYTSVSERCTNAVEGVDYPTGWVLEEDVSDKDISITHNLNRRIAEVNVLMVDNGEERLLRNNLGYAGFVAKSKNRLVIEGLSTIGYPLVIQLIFAR